MGGGGGGGGATAMLCLVSQNSQQTKTDRWAEMAFRILTQFFFMRRIYHYSHFCLFPRWPTTTCTNACQPCDLTEPLWSSCPNGRKSFLVPHPQSSKTPTSKRSPYQPPTAVVISFCRDRQFYTIAPTLSGKLKKKTSFSVCMYKKSKQKMKSTKDTRFAWVVVQECEGKLRNA